MRLRSVRVVQRLLLRGGLGCLLVGIYFLTSSIVHVAYAASNTPTCAHSVHCYGIATWYSSHVSNVSSSFAGAFTDISMVHLYTGNRGVHLFTHEMWLQEDSSRCNSGSYYSCWIETGYGNFRASYDGTFYAGMYYFWAEKRPADSTIHVHILGPVSSNQFGSVQKYHIKRIGRTSYEIEAGSYIAYSRGNTMVANRMSIGEELANDGGVAATSAQQALFTSTAWWDASNWHFLQNASQVTAMRPFAVNWLGSGSSGGQTFSASCCTL